MENSEEIRILLTQTITNRRFMTWNKLMEVLGEMCDKYDLPPPTKESTTELVGKINKHLNVIKDELIVFQHPADKTEYLVYLPSVVRGPDLTPTESYYFSRLIEEIVRAPEYSIRDFEVYVVMPRLVRLSMMRMKDLFEQWVDSGYFLDKGHYIHLGPRTMVELAKQLERKTWCKGYIFKCPLCQEITFCKTRCQICSTRFHDACIRKWLVENSCCFSCKMKWHNSSQ